jgi:hypothetical protein
VVKFWWQNTGLYLPIILAALLWRTPTFAKLLAGSGLIVFAAANTFAFAPWIWDNYKLFVYWFLWSLPAVGWLAAQGLGSRRVWLMVPTILLVLLHLQTGMIDLAKTLLPTAQTWGEWDTGTLAFAQALRALTPRDAIILTAPYHNTPAALSGRRVYLGFSGHVWSHGGNPFAREAAIAKFYQGELVTLPEINVHYVVVGPVEQRQFPSLKIRPDWQLIHQQGPYRLYKLPEL